MELFSLGEQYVSDFVAKSDVTNGHLVPITLLQCRACTLVQQKYTAPQDFLYTRHYWYRSGVTDTMRKQLADVAIAAARYLRRGDLALDIGSNDGTFLRMLKLYCPDITTIGVEPANNLVAEGRRGLDLLIHDFWSFGALQTAGVKQFKVITALGMFYDLEDPNQFIRDVSLALHPEGVFIAQLMCAQNMLDMGDVGNLCHEHLEFYTLKSLDELFATHGLELFDAEENSVNGRSTRLFVGKQGKRRRSQRLASMLNADKSLHTPKEWQKFYDGARYARDACVCYVHEACAQGKRVWVYGASTKGNVLLQWYGLDRQWLEGAAERSQEKHGKFTIGTGIPIHAEEYARPRADYFLALPYAFIAEFLKREEAFVTRGGKFLVPLPRFRVTPS